MSKIKGFKIAFWGHGKNFQGNPESLSEKLKSLISARVDWWFGYTNETKSIIINNGFPEKNITVLNNAIDNKGFSENLHEVSQGDLDLLRQKYGIKNQSFVSVFCGTLYENKRLDFLIEAGDRLAQEIDGYKMFLIGEGPLYKEMMLCASEREWMHCVGARRGLEKAQFFKLSNVMLNPGLVGLHVLDAFVASLPIFTMADSKHSPEVSYIENGVNGFIINGGINEYVNTIIKISKNHEILNKTKLEAEKSSQIYTLKSMVDNFREGILNCLKNKSNSQ